MAKPKEQVCIWLKKRDKVMLHMIKTKLGCGQSAAIRASIMFAMTHLGLATKDDLLEDIRELDE
jgi:hypothetical protein